MSAQAVSLDYELSTPLDQMEASTPLNTGPDILALLRILAELDQFTEDKPRKVSWRLAKDRAGGASLVSVANPEIANRACLSLVRGFRAAEDKIEVPPSWSLQAGVRARTIARRLGDSASTGLKLVASAEETAEATVTRQASQNLEQATKVRYTSYGSVIGVLGGVNAHGRLSASLWSDVDGRRVQVSYAAEHLEQIREAWAKSHVEISGLVHENSVGQILKIEMTDLVILESPSINLLKDLPWGFYPEMTGGLSVKEYMDVIRGE